MSRGVQEFVEERNSELFRLYDECCKELKEKHGEEVFNRLPRMDIIDHMIESKSFSRIYMNKQNIFAIIGRRHCGNNINRRK